MDNEIIPKPRFTIDQTRRMRIISEMLRDQYSTNEIVKALVDKFGISEGTAYKDVKLLWEEWNKYEPSLAERKETHRQALGHLYRTTLGEGEWETARKVLGDLAKVDNLAPDRVDIKKESTHRQLYDLTFLTDEELSLMKRISDRALEQGQDEVFKLTDGGEEDESP